MAKRRYQTPKPERNGNFWYVRIRHDCFENGRNVRKLVRLKIAPAATLEREVRKIAAELIRPMNQCLILIGSAVNFSEFVQSEYIPIVLPLLAKITQDSYEGTIAKYLQPAFGGCCLRDLTPRVLATVLFELEDRSPPVVKVRDALSSILRSAVPDFLVKTVVQHFSQFVPLGPVRVASSEMEQLASVAFLTPEDKVVLVVSNIGNFPKPFAVKYHGKIFQTVLPAESVGTYVW